MRYCKKMQEVIEELCQKHEVDWKEESIHLEIPSNHIDTPLTIEKAGSTVSVTYYIEKDSGDWLCDPGILLAITPKGWIVLLMSVMDKHYRCTYRVANTAVIENEYKLRMATNYTETWANNLRENYL